MNISQFLLKEELVLNAGGPGSGPRKVSGYDEWKKALPSHTTGIDSTPSDRHIAYGVRPGPGSNPKYVVGTYYKNAGYGEVKD